MIRHSISILGLRVIGGLLTLMFQILVTRSLETELAGLFFFLVSSIFILQLVSLCGLDTEAIRLAAPYLKEGRKTEFTQIVKKGTTQIGMNGLILLPLIGGMAFLFLTSAGNIGGISSNISGQASNQIIWETLSTLSLFSVVPFTAVLVVFTLHTFFIAMTRCAGEITASSLALSFFPGFLSLVLLGGSALFFEQVNILTVIICWAFAHILTLGFSTLRLRRVFHNADTTKDTPSRRDLLRGGAPVMTIQLLSQIPWQGAVLIAWLILDPVSVAVFAVCLRLAEIVSMPGMVIGFLGQPYLARELPTENRKSIGTVMGALGALVAVPTFLGVCVLLFAGDLLLGGFYGSDYAQGGLAAALIAAGRWFETALGIGSYSTLIMASYRRLTFKITLASCGVFIAVLGISYYSFGGLLSLSLAVFSYYAVRSLMLTYAAWIYVGVATWPLLSPRKIIEGARLLENDRAIKH